MNISYNGNNSKIIEATKFTNAMINDLSYYRQIELFQNFTHSTYPGKKVTDEMQNNFNILIETYWNPLSGTAGKTQTKININSAKLSRSIACIVKTILHESVHYVDWAVNQKWYSTDLNFYESPTISAPYKIGILSEKLAPAQSNKSIIKT